MSGDDELNLIVLFELVGGNMGSLVKLPVTGHDIGVKYSVKSKYSSNVEIRIDSKIFTSAPFRLLSGKAMWVMLRFLQKRKWNPKKKSRKEKTIYCNSGLVFTYDEAVFFGISQSQFHIIIKKLVALGFVDVEYQGGCHNRDYSRYAVSDRWKDYGKSSFIKVEKKRVLQPGLDVRSRINKMKKATKNSSAVSTENNIYEPETITIGYH